MFRDFMDLDEVRLQLPIDGHVYNVKPMTGDLARRAEEAMTSAAPEIPAAEMRVMALGPVFQEMLADNVPTTAIDRAVLTVLTDLFKGREAAEVMWETGGDQALTAAWVAKNAPTPVSAKKVAAKKAPAKKAPPRATPPK
ncbi:hypothetical protein BH10ACT8_BH10ACT8_11210 [soil metagenome]